MRQNADYWISSLGLEKHPEGGYFREIYRSEEGIAAEHLPERFSGSRSFATSIYFLLKGNEFSTLHRLCADEIWHFYTGSALTLYKISSEESLESVVLGQNHEAGEQFQAIIPAGSWFGAAANSPDGFSLLGCGVAPGFDFRDFELGNRETLLKAYPRHQEIIRKLTPEY